MESYSSQPRRAERVKRNLFTRIRIWKNEFEPIPNATWDIIKIQNISSSGIYFNYHKKIYLNTVVEFKIFVPYGEEVRCRAKICRIEEKQLSNSGMNQIIVYGIAAKFFDIEKSKCRLIDKYANEFSCEETN